MRVLVACEESQRVCKEFRKRGHEAYSCDLLPAGGGSSGMAYTGRRTGDCENGMGYGACFSTVYTSGS